MWGEDFACHYVRSTGGLLSMEGFIVRQVPSRSPLSSSYTPFHLSFIHSFEVCNVKLTDRTCRTCGLKTHSPKEPWRPSRRVSSTSGGAISGFWSLF